MAHVTTLREERCRQKPLLTQVELAKRSGVDQTYISLLERGLRIPSKDIKRRLAKALGIAPSRLRFSEPQPDETLDHASDRVGHSGTGPA
jgi:transcriptional regulator with XRE-family HTH domain